MSGSLVFVFSLYVHIRTWGGAYVLRGWVPSGRSVRLVML